VPRRTHALKNAAASAVFRATLARELWALDVPREKPVRVWAIDEHRYGLISHQRRCWGMRRVRPHARYRTKYEWGYVATALEVGGRGEGLCVFFPTVNQEVSTRFLEQISQSDPHSVHVILQDRAGFHLRAGAVELPANVRLLPLPAYSPELNPVERVGGLIRTATANRVFRDLETMEAAMVNTLRPLWTDPARVRSLIGEGWLLTQVNAFSN
jgi:hypothetical protein